MARMKFFLGRVHKIGRVTHQSIVEAIKAPVDIVEREYRYSFVDSHVEMKGNSIQYIYAKLVKFEAVGPVTVVDTKKHVTIESPVEYKMDASVAFVYVPQYEGIAFHRVWNKLTPPQFISRFDKLISEKLERVMARVEIEPIANLEKFAQRIKRFKSLDDISATVTPPNPLFGPAWESLKAHLESRNLKQLKIAEEAKQGESIATGIHRLLALLEAKAKPAEIKEALKTTSIADQAILMAGDGYGNAKIHGVDQDGRERTYSTRDDQISFEFSHEPSKEELFERTHAELVRINNQRHLDH